MTPYYQREGVTLYNADCRDVLPTLGRVDCVITDPPYSERTHKGHDLSANGHDGEGNDNANRKALGYEAWTNEDARQYVDLMCGACDAWMVVMTDHTLMPQIHASMNENDRYVFAPLPYFAPGSRVRLSGDGPSCWTIWIVVSRTAKQARWGTLPGGYLEQPGWRERVHMGGKPTGLMRALLKDYSRPGDLILDPFTGSGTTAVACIEMKRRFIGVELSREYCDVTVGRIETAFEKAKQMEFAL